MFEPEHPWLKEGGEASEKHEDNAVLNRMEQFKAMNQMKKLAMKVRQIFQSCIKFNQINDQIPRKSESFIIKNRVTLSWYGKN